MMRTQAFFAITITLMLASSAYTNSTNFAATKSKANQSGPKPVNSFCVIETLRGWNGLCKSSQAHVCEKQVRKVVKKCRGVKSFPEERHECRISGENLIRAFTTLPDRIIGHSSRCLKLVPRQ